MRNRSRRIVKTAVSILGLMAALLLTVPSAHSSALYTCSATASEQGGNYSGTCTMENGHLNCSLQLVSGAPVSTNMKTTATIYTAIGVLSNRDATIFKNGTFSISSTY